MNLNILTYNVEAGKKIDEIIFWLSEKNIDIVCLQEFPEYLLSDIENRKIFTNYSYAFSKGLVKNKNQLGQLTLYKKNSFVLKKEFSVDLGRDKIFPTKRTALITNFHFNNCSLTVINVHLSAFTLNSDRMNQVKLLISNLGEDNLIILGDFNYSNLLRGRELVSFMLSNRFQLAGDKIITNKYKGIIRQQLDYIFYKNITLNKVRIENIDYSDHFPIYGEFSFNL